MRLCLASNLQDEVKNIRQLWDCFHDNVDHWLVVDSGSTDGTQEELRQVVGDRLRLIEDPMIKIHGYGHARTQLVELNHDADWVLIMDGDERMFPSDVKKVREIVDSDPPYDMICLPRCHYQSWDMTKVEYGGMDKIGNDWREAIRINADWQPRLIKRDMINGKNKLIFKNYVHEQVCSSTGHSLRILNDLTMPVIRHFGWMKTPDVHEMNRTRMKFISDLCDNLCKKERGE